MWKKNTRVSSQLETLDRQSAAWWYRWLELMSVALETSKRKIGQKIISSNTYLIPENILVSHEEGGPAFPSSSNLRAGSMPRPRFVDLGSEPQDS